MILNALQYLGCSMGVAGLLILTFLPQRVSMGMVISSVSCMVLAVYGYYTAQYGVLIAQSVYIILYLVAAINWLKRKVS